MNQTNIQGQVTSRASNRRAITALLAAGVLLLGSASIAHARTETIRWTHSNTADVEGFRVYQSSTPGSSGSLEVDLLLAETAQEAGGAFFHSLDIPDGDTVYITLTAYSPEDVESFRSNEKALAPPVVDSDGDGVPDGQDAFPNDPSETADSDGDGVGDNSDVFPNDASEWADSDGDGVGDVGDVFPNDASEWADSDGDGYGDNIDDFPNDPTRYVDTGPVRILSPYRVSAGETEDQEAPDGRTWTRDVGFWNTGLSNTIDPDTPIGNTSSDDVYRSSRTSTDTSNKMMFSFPLSNGAYTVRLHFSENTHTAAGQRVFDVEIQDALELQDFDIFANAGNRQHWAVVEEFEVDVTDELLVIRFLHRPGGSDPTVMGIEVVSLDADEGEVLTTPGRPVVIDVN